MSEDVHDIQREVRRYLLVFVALAFLTIVTVAVSYLHLQILPAIVLALIIASIKASLVGCYFMHLISEEKMIYAVLILVVIFLVAILFLPFGTFLDHIPGTQHVT